MLSKFEICRNWYSTKVTIFVDCARQEASFLVTHNRRILPAFREEDYTIRFDLVRDPRAAEDWLNERIEALHASAQRHFAE